MKKLTLIPSLLILLLLATIAAQHAVHSSETYSAPVYEYASVRFMGGEKTSIVWPDGEAQPLSQFNPARRPDGADDRMFHLTLAMNILAQRGFEPVAIPSIEPHSDDIWARRLVNR